MTDTINILIAIGLAAMRISGQKSQAFQATAHLFVGAMFAAAYFGKRSFYLWVAVVLSLVELACFLVGLIR